MPVLTDFQKFLVFFDQFGLPVDVEDVSNLDIFDTPGVAQTCITLTPAKLVEEGKWIGEITNVSKTWFYFNDAGEFLAGESSEI